MNKDTMYEISTIRTKILTFLRFLTMKLSVFFERRNMTKEASVYRKGIQYTRVVYHAVVEDDMDKSVNLQQDETEADHGGIGCGLCCFFEDSPSTESQRRLQLEHKAAVLQRIKAYSARKNRTVLDP